MIKKYSSPASWASWPAQASPPMTSSPPPNPHGTFKTLTAALDAAGKTAMLQEKGPFTVFAPSDEAFAKLPAGTVDDLLKPENKEKLGKLLTYHVIKGKVMAAMLRR